MMLLKLDIQKIKIALAEKGLSQKQLCENMGMKYATFYATLRKGYCKPVTVHRIAKGIGVKVTDIIEKTEE